MSTKYFDTKEEEEAFFIRLEKIRKKYFQDSNTLMTKTLGIARSCGGRWSRRENYPSLDILARISKATGLNLDEIIFGENKDKKDNVKKMSNKNISFTKEERENLFSRLLEIKKIYFQDLQIVMKEKLKLGSMVWLKKKYLPAVKTLMKISKVTGLSVDYIVFGEEKTQLEEENNILL